MENIGFIGLGVMGRPMALNLVKGGFRLFVYSRKEDAAAPLVRFGATVCNSPKDVTAQSDVIITMLTDTESVESIVLGEGGIVEAAAEGKVLIDMSTVDPDASRKIAQALEAKSMDCLDAPVSGGEQGAKDGSLSIMIGGKIPVFRRAKPLLQMMGNCTYVGDHGAGQVAKACNQLVVTQTIAAVAEALLLAKAAGVDPENVRQALLGGSAYSKILEIHGKRMLAGDFEPGFRAQLHAKDLAILRRLAEQSGLALDFTELAAQTIETLAQTEENLDSSAAVLQLEKRFGIQLSGTLDKDKKQVR